MLTFSILGIRTTAALRVSAAAGGSPLTRLWMRLRIAFALQREICAREDIGRERD